MAVSNPVIFYLQWFEAIDLVQSTVLIHWTFPHNLLIISCTAINWTLLNTPKPYCTALPSPTLHTSLHSTDLHCTKQDWNFFLQCVTTDHWSHPSPVGLGQTGSHKIDGSFHLFVKDTLQPLLGLEREEVLAQFNETSFLMGAWCQFHHTKKKQSENFPAQKNSFRRSEC